MIGETVPLLRRRIRALTAFFILSLVLSGATAMPLETEVGFLAQCLGARADSAHGALWWLARIHGALAEINLRHPFAAYGTDWLAFAHFAIALAFVWAWRDPVGNRWLYDYGLICCALVIPFALLAGHVRGIPLGWRLIDCGFGVFGALPLLLCRRWAAVLSDASRQQSEARQDPRVPG